MNEKKFLIYLLILFFIVFSMMGFMIFEAHLQKTQVSIMLEYEKLMGRYYSNYIRGESLDSHIIEEISGFGFYNYYGDPLYLHGTATPDIETSPQMPFFNKDRQSIVIVRDLLLPFIPMFRDHEMLDELNQEYVQSIEKKSPEFREKMVRYVYMEIKDSNTYRIITFFRIAQGTFILVVISLVFFIWRLYTKNMAYRKQIDEQERLVVLGTAARTLTHEIKNPLSSIRLQSTIIKRSSCRLHDASLQIINEEVDRLSLLTERVGDFLRHPEGELLLCDLNREVCKIMERYSHSLSYSCHEEMFPVLFDPDRFRSILENLLNNALQSGSEPSDINISLEKKENEVILIVSDKGRGIPKENIEHLYDPFFTTKSTGSGIGLSIVHSFVNAAGGRLKIESEPDMGTSVSVIFPRYKKEEDLS